jgi:hypothetical protein
MTIEYPDSEVPLEPFDVQIVSFQGFDDTTGCLKVYTDPGGMRTLLPAAITRVR